MTLWEPRHTAETNTIANQIFTHSQHPQATKTEQWQAQEPQKGHTVCTHSNVTLHVQRVVYPGQQPSTHLATHTPPPQRDRERKSDKAHGMR